MNKLLENSQNIRKFLTELGISYKIAGGYARDKFFNRTPRDLDIVIFNLSEARISSKFYGILAYCDMTGVTAKHSIQSEDSEYHSDRVFGVITLFGGIDLIFWNSGFETIQQVMDGFDYNLNQFTYSEEFGPVFHGEQEKFGVLQQLRGSEITPEREQKMKLLAVRCQWSLPAYEPKSYFF
jgi:hypothetical protein